MEYISRKYLMKIFRVDNNILFTENAKNNMVFLNLMFREEHYLHIYKLMSKIKKSFAVLKLDVNI